MIENDNPRVPITHREFRSQKPCIETLRRYAKSRCPQPDLKFTLGRFDRALVLVDRHADGAAGHPSPAQLERGEKNPMSQNWNDRCGVWTWTFAGRGHLGPRGRTSMDPGAKGLGTPEKSFD